MRSRATIRRKSALDSDPSCSGGSGPLLPRTLRPALGPAAGHVTECLHARLTPAQIAAVPELLREEHRAMWEQASVDERKSLTLAFGLLYNVDGISERTGLVGAVPPASVHSMVRGMDGETGGSYQLADMVMESLLGIGRPLATGAEALDFSCSSGRVVRALAAAVPEVTWRGCDPNAAAIRWAEAHLPAIDFFVSETEPPLPIADRRLLLAFGISVWSHFSAASALWWLVEMARVVMPRGHLLVTSHGMNSCEWFERHRDAAIEAKLGHDWIRQTVRRLELDGHCFWDVFGTTGDWGVVDPGWGLAFFTPEWLLSQITPMWSLRLYRIGRAQGNQDIYLLERE